MSILRAARALWRTPGSTAACALTLSLGIAASTVMFTLIHSLLLRPLPYPEVRQLAAIEPAISWGDVREIEAHAHTVSSAAVYLKRTWGFTDTSHAPVEVVLAGMVSHGFFDALGVRPARGVGFDPGMEATGSNRVMWLTHEFWTRRYAGRADAVGSVVALNDFPYRVAGVLPEGFRFPMEGENPDVYIPLDRADYCCDRGARSLNGIVRRAAGASRAAAAAELASITGTRYSLTSLQLALLGDRTRPLVLLGLAAGLMLLVSAANAAAILLARAARNARDAAIKASLGADLRRLFQEQAEQGLWIGLAAAALGVGLAAAAPSGAKLVPALENALLGYAQIAAIRMDLRVAGFAVALSVVTAISAAVMPLWLVRVGLEQVLRGGSASVRSVRGRNGLVAAQIALSTILLGTGALVLGQLRAVLSADKGFRTDQIVLAGIGIPEARYDTDARMIAFHERVIEKLRAIPGVTDAGGGAGMPMAGGHSAFQFAGQNLAKKDRPRVLRGVVSPGLLRLLGIAVVQGRGFTAQDREGHPYVVLVNRRFVARYGKSVGDRLEVGFWNGHMQPWPQVEIIGVIADARNEGIEQAPEPAVYFSTLQVPLEGFLYFVRTSRPAAGLTAEFRQAVWSVDPNLERVSPRPLAPYVEAGLESRRLGLWLAGSFGMIALALAAAGLGASVSAWVTESMRETAIRVALGETPAGVVGRVLRRSVRVAGAGLAAGVPLAWLAARVLQSRIAPSFATGAAPLLAVLGVILAAALTASAWPAMRAARLDPAEMLRRE